MQASEATMAMMPETGNLSSKFQFSSPSLGPETTPVKNRTSKSPHPGLSSVASNNCCDAASEKDACQQFSTRLSDLQLASRKAELAATRRFQAASWLQQMIGPLDLPSEPIEEEFRLILRNGLVLCNLINKIRPGTISKVVEITTPSPPEGPALSAFQYFENVRNFLVAVEEMKLPSFEASDLEEGGLETGSLVKVVDCILALKSYCEWKQNGGQGFWKFGGTLKSPCSSFYSNRRETFVDSTARGNEQRKLWSLPSPNCPGNLPEELAGSFAYGRKPLKVCGGLHSMYDALDGSGNAWPSPAWIHDINEKVSSIFQVKSKCLQEAASEMPGMKNGNFPSTSLLSLVTTLLEDKQPVEVPLLVEFLLSKVVEQFEQRLSGHEEQIKSCQSKEDNKLKEDATHGIKDQQEQQAKIHSLQLELEQVKFMDQEREFCLEVQKNEIEGLKFALQSTKQEVVKMQNEWNEEINTLDAHFQGLAHAAEQYQKVVAENRELYNQVQDLKGNIRVYCRVRPFLTGQNGIRSTVDFIGENGSIMIVNPMRQGKDQRRTFNFNKVFGPSACQEEVFLDTQPLIRSVLDGYNVCIFAYGQTGSGKTHTMTGPDTASQKDWGVNFRTLHDLFQISRSRKDLMNYEVNVQMIEIYNEQVRDLLCIDGANKRLEIRNSSQQNGINVPNANMVHVKSTSDVIELMNLGHKNRSIGATALNERSSRSHSVLTVHVQGTILASGTVLRGCLHLVDLAGSERVDKSEATGDRLKEAQHINKSLSALGDVISALAQKSNHIPYRNSKLTQLLQDSLGGQAKTLMFVHISPDEDSHGETISTLKFAERVSTVELGAAHSNRESGEVRDLKEQIASLKEALAKRDAEIERLQKDFRTKGIESCPEKIRTKTEISPSPSRGMIVEVQSQVNHRQPLEEVHNAEVRQSHMFGTNVRKYTENSDILENCQLGSHPQLSSRNEVCSGSQEQDLISQRANKAVRGGFTSESRSLNSEICYSRTPMCYSNITRNKIHPENYEDEDGALRSQERLGSSQDIAVTSDEISNATFSEQPSSRSLATERGELKAVDWTTEPKSAEGISKRRSGIKRNLQTKDSKETNQSQNYSAENSAGRRGDIEEKVCDNPEAELWKGREDSVWPGAEQKHRSNVLPPASCGKLGHSSDAGSSSPMQQSGTSHARNNRKRASGGVGQGDTHPRRSSLIGSTFGVDSLSTKRSGGKPTLEAKLVAITPEGVVECYAKATLPRQSYSTQVGISSKSSKRWL